MTPQLPRAKALRTVPPLKVLIGLGRRREDRRKGLLPKRFSGKQSKLKREVGDNRDCSTSEMRPSETTNLEGKVSPAEASNHPKHRA